MNEHIKQLETFITTGKQPVVKSSIFKLSKAVYQQHGDSFKEMANSIATEGTCSKDSVAYIISKVGTSNKGREIAGFVFVVTVGTMFDLDFDIREVIPMETLKL